MDHAYLNISNNFPEPFRTSQKLFKLTSIIPYCNRKYLLFDALEDVTTVPALAAGGEPSTAVARLLRGENVLDTVMSDSPLPLFPGNR